MVIGLEIVDGCAYLEPRSEGQCDRDVAATHAVWLPSLLPLDSFHPVPVTQDPPHPATTSSSQPLPLFLKHSNLMTWLINASSFQALG